MKFQRIIEAIYRTPLAISPVGFETVDMVFRAHVRGQRPEKDIWGDAMPQMQIEDGAAVIPVYGPLMQHASLLDKQCGATSYDDILEDAKNATNRGDVSMVFFDFNSPGGECRGCLETAEALAELQDESGVPFYAWTDTQCCSAAYFLASSCQEVFCSRTSMVGSIGTILSFLDTSKAFEMEGLKAEIFASGKFKGAGADGTTLTDEQRSYFQGLCDSAFLQFADHVADQRPDIEAEAMEGQVFWGGDAVKPGVADVNFDSMAEAMDYVDPDVGLPA